MRLLLDIVLSLLPEAWRGGHRADVELPRGAIISGVVGLLACLALLGYRYPAFVRSQFTAGVTEAALGSMEKGGETAVMGLGPLLLLAYLTQPLSLLLVYFMAESLVRVLAALVGKEVIPTLPLWLLSLADSRARAYRRELALGPRVIDSVQKETAGADLQISSCRPKPWNRLTTVGFEDQLYEVVEQRSGVAPRPYIYLLRRHPEGKVVRGVHHYSADESLPERERARAAGK